MKQKFIVLAKEAFEDSKKGLVIFMGLLLLATSGNRVIEGLMKINASEVLAGLLTPVMVILVLAGSYRGIKFCFDIIVKQLSSVAELFSSLKNKNINEEDK